MPVGINLFRGQLSGCARRLPRGYMEINGEAKSAKWEQYKDNIHTTDQEIHNTETASSLCYITKFCLCFYLSLELLVERRK